MSLWELEAVIIGFINFHCGDGKSGESLSDDEIERLSALIEEA